MSILSLQSRRSLLRMLLRHNLALCLFVNDADVANAKLSDLNELSGHGYHPKDLHADAWTMEIGKSIAKHPKVKWVFEGGTPTEIHGYYVVWKADGRLAWAEKFPDGPYSIRYRGDQLTVQPKLTLDAD